MLIIFITTVIVIIIVIFVPEKMETNVKNSSQRGESRDPSPC